MKIISWGKEYDVTAYKMYYANNNALAIRLTAECGPFATLTVNLSESDRLEKDCAYVDTNNCPWAEQFIEENKLGEPMGTYGFSGFCSYPLYKFNMDRLKDWRN